MNILFIIYIFNFDIIYSSWKIDEKKIILDKRTHTFELHLSQKQFLIATKFKFSWTIRITSDVS